MIVSTDNGATWSPGLDQTPYRVIRQHWYNSDKDATLYTDQMPVVVRLNDGDRLAAVVESSVSCVNGNTSYAISFAYSDSEGQWPRLEGTKRAPPTVRTTCSTARDLSSCSSRRAKPSCPTDFRAI